MKQRRGGFALLVSIVLGSSIGLLAQNKDEKKRDDAQKKEIQNIVKIVDDAAAGQAAANDLSLTWLREDVLKAQGNKEYVPFTVSVDPSKVTGDKVAFYWRGGAEGGAKPDAGGGPGRHEGEQEEGQEGDKEEGRQGQEDGLRLRGHQFRAGDPRTEPTAYRPIVHRPCRHLRCVPRRQGADSGQGAEERAAAQDVPRQADDYRARLLERRPRHQLGDPRAAD